jgi:hypothetical protein
MVDVKNLSENELKNAIWAIKNGSVAIGGLPIESYRRELLRRGLDGKGFHE